MEHKYRGFAGIGVVVGKGMGILVIIIFTAFAVFMPIQAAVVKGLSFALNIGCLGLWFMLIGWTVGLGLVNQNPSVWLESDHLGISAFLFGRVKIPWSEVVKVTVKHAPFELVVIQANRITLFHRLYGWLYCRTCKPAFIIRPEIDNYVELVSEITRRVDGIPG